MKCDYREICVLVCTNTTECIRIYKECILSHELLILADEHITMEQLGGLVESFQVNYLILPCNMRYPDGIIMKVFHEYYILKLSGYEKHWIDDRLAILLSTSGSTGSRKYVRISYSNLFENTSSIIEALGISGEDVAITTLPINYTYGLSVINTHLQVGAKIVATKKSFLQKEFWNLVNDEGVTSFSGVPYMYELFHKFRLDYMANSIKVFTQAGGKLDNAIIAYMVSYAEQNNKRFVTMYGQTEATARMTCMPKGREKDKLGSVGVAIKNGNIYVAEKGQKVGEIVYEGPNVCLGYATTYRDLLKEDENCGRLYTGDIGYVDEEGFLYLTGRKDRNVKYFGKRINLDEAENEITKEFGIKAFIILKDNFLYVYIQGNKGRIDVAGIGSFIERELQVYHATYSIRWISSVPYLSNGKIDYVKLLKETV